MAAPTLARQGNARNVVREPVARTLDPGRFRRRRRRAEIALAVTTPALLLALWEICGRAGWLDPQFFPPPSEIWDIGVDLVRDGKLQHHVYVSSRRVVLGFLLGSGVGVGFGVVFGVSRVAWAALEPIIYALWTVPKVALLPLMLLVLGLGEKPIIVLIAISCGFLTLIPTVGAVRGVDPAYAEVARSMEASWWQRLRTIVVPAALPQIFVALRLAAGAGALTVVAAEFVQGDDGLGFLIWNSWSLYRPQPMYVGIVAISVLGTVLTLIVGRIGRRLSPWFEERR